MKFVFEFAYAQIVCMAVVLPLLDNARRSNSDKFDHHENQSGSDHHEKQSGS